MLFHLHICIVQLKSTAMKTLKTLFVLLLMATSALAQWNPDNMFISGNVTDANGMPVDSHQVCVSYISTNPALPSDTLCTTTNNNGYYFFDLVNGSVSGANVTFHVSTYDPCSFVELTHDRDNYQGTIDTANVNFSICANTQSCDVSFTYYNDSINGTWMFEANASGTPPFTYDWWIDGASHSTQTVTHVFNSNSDTIVYVSITDANGCSSTALDTLTLHDNSNPTCSAWIQASIDTFGISTLEAHATGVAPYSYVWSNGQTTPTIMTELAGVYCVDITDATGCVSTSCETITSTNTCAVEITTTIDSTGGGLVYTLTASGGFAQYVWDNNQTGQSITVQNPNPNGGIHCVTASDLNGCTITNCDTLLPLNTNCNVTITADGPLVSGSGVSLTAFGNGPGPYSYYWTPSGETTAIINVSTEGQYCVEVTNADGCIAFECIEVQPSNSNCDASFTSSGPTGIGYTFSANIQDSNIDYYWTIDNQYAGGGFEMYSPGFTSGNHTICLTVTDSLSNCFDTECQTITVDSANCNGYISGQAFAGSNNQPLNSGVVYLILHDQISNTLSAVDSMVLDSGNWYFFGPLDCGDYFIKAAAHSNSPYYNNHIPTYYGNSPFWGFAQTVSITTPGVQITADVTLIASNNPGGPGFIGGYVSQGANKTDEGDPLAGMQVMLFDMNGNAIAYTYTDANGAFGFSNLAYGTYQVYVEALGVQTIPAVVTIGSEQPSVESIQILVSESLISTGIEMIDFDAAISEVYPNPVLNRATINFNLNSEVTVILSVLDLTGRTVSTRTVSIASGENMVKVDSENLKGGYYFLNIQEVDGSFSITRKFMRVD